MYLKKLTCYGFKSFGQKVEIDFKNGITAIVGPNGSGKSNINDAIQWVLGEQSIKSLRGSKSEDIIFAGSNSKKPLGIAEVSITIDNQDRKLPVDYSEVNITRRIFRSGDSEFYINKTPCRLKDIHELLADTGVGKDGYSIISQGKIDEIINSKPNERRNLFEEATGIVKYKNRKKESEKKLEETTQNILRVEDLILELSNQIEPLREQAKIAMEYKKLKENLDNIEIKFMVANIGRLHEKLGGIEETLVKINDKILKTQSTINKIEAEIQEEIVLMDKCEEKLSELQSNIYQKQNLLDRIEEKVNNNNLNYRRNQTDIDELLTEKEDLQENLNRKTIESETLQKEILDIQLELNELQKLIAQRERDLQEIEQSYQDNDTYLLELKRELYEIHNKKSSINSSISTIETLIKNLIIREKQISDEILANSKKIDEHKIIIENNHSKLKDLEENTENLKIKLHNTVETQNTLQKEISTYENMIREIQVGIKGREEKVKLLEGLENNYEGYSKGVKLLMNWSSQVPQRKEKIFGPVAKLFKCPEKYETAVETALGAGIQYIVVEDDKTAQDAIEILKKNQWGRVTFLPIKSINTRTFTNDEIILFKQYPGYCGTCSELLDYKDYFKPIFENLLGRTLVFNTLEDAIKFSRETKNRFRIVTLEGELLNPGGSITGGKTNKENQGFLSRSRELKEIKEEIKVLVLEYERILKLYNKRCEDNKVNAALLSQTEILIKENQSKEMEINNNIILNNSILQQLNNEINKLIQEKNQLIEETQKLKNQNELHIKEINSYLKKEEELSSKISEINEITKDQKIKGENFSKGLTQLQIELARKQQQYANKQREYSKLQEYVNELNNKILGINNRIIALEEQNQGIRELLLSFDKEAKDIIAELEKLKEEISKEQEARKGYKEKEEEYNNMLKSLNKEINRLQNDYYKKDTEKTRIEAEFNMFCQNLLEYYNLTYERAQSRYHIIDFDVSDYQNLKSKLKNEIDSLGEVNLGSIEEFERVNTRYSFLCEQRDDLINAKESLLKIIYEITEKMKNKFLEGIEKINICFNEVFRELFAGGYANLSLTDVNNPLEAGIEIIAQPPGKKLQNLSLLSGGEKSLTAIAILFAILKYKPAPFCVLDEIEASLDDANVERFSKYLLSISKHCQFIIITHRKGTMEVADSLYGITMDKEGISKLVSVEFDNKNKAS